MHVRLRGVLSLRQVTASDLFLAFLLFSGLCSSTTPADAQYVQLNVPGRHDYAFDNAGILYISSTQGRIERYDTSTDAFLTPFDIGGWPTGIDLSPDGHTLAVADYWGDGYHNRVQLVDTATGAARHVNFEIDYGENGTFMVAWGADRRLLISSTYAGSGDTPLRRYDPSTDTMTIISEFSKSAMLTPSADRRTIAIVSVNTSGGPVTDYDVVTGDFDETIGTGYWTFEVAVDRDGDQFMVPTYFGALIYTEADAFQLQTVIGRYDLYGPLAGVYSPVNDRLFTSEWSCCGFERGVRVYDSNTMQLLETIDPYPFEWNGNHAMGPGRMEISPDGRYLAVSVHDGVRVYDVSRFVPEPSGWALACVGATFLGGVVLRRRYG